MNHPIAMIPYANMAPYETLGPPEGCYFVPCTPRNSIEALKSGVVWAAAMPVGGLAALEGLVEPVGAFGIAAYREVMSVLFFSDRPFEGFKAPQTVRLTNESASSVRLLYLLLGYQNGFERVPSLAVSGAPANGELLIGDAALKWLQLWERNGEVKGYPHVTDLAAQWERQHHLPFVFARWVARIDAPEKVRASLKCWLDSFAGQESVLIEQSVPKVARQLDLPRDFVARYLKVIRRCLTAEDQAGQKKFLEEWRRRGAELGNVWFASEAPTSMARTHTHE
jgi:predicted solute-binding protein